MQDVQAAKLLHGVIGPVIVQKADVMFYAVCSDEQIRDFVHRVPALSHGSIVSSRLNRQRVIDKVDDAEAP